MCQLPALITPEVRCAEQYPRSLRWTAAEATSHPKPIQRCEHIPVTPTGHPARRCVPSERSRDAKAVSDWLGRHAESSAFHGKFETEYTRNRRSGGGSECKREVGEKKTSQGRRSGQRRPSRLRNKRRGLGRFSLFGALPPRSTRPTDAAATVGDRILVFGYKQA